MGCCQPKCRCENFLSAIEDTNTIDLSGNGSPGTPLKGDVILAPTVIHPLTLAVLPNGISAGVAGLEAQPDRQFGFSVIPPLPGGQPPITVDTAGGEVAGQAIWGTGVTGSAIGYDANRDTLAQRTEERPIVTATLEPGATVSVGHKVNAFGFLDWHIENTTASIQTTTIWLGYLVAIDSIIPAGVANPGPLETWDMLIRTTGFTGASSVSTVGDRGMSVVYYGWPL